MKKRGVSEIVSYTLLIVIALSISVLVYAYLKVYVPKEKPECKEGINLIIEEVNCNFTRKELSLVLQNRGLFKVETAFIRIGKSSELKKIVSGANPVTLYSNAGTLYLRPQESTYLIAFNISSAVASSGEYIIEVQPAHFTKEGSKNPDTLALCPSITQTIGCY